MADPPPSPAAPAQTQVHPSPATVAAPAPAPPPQQQTPTHLPAQSPNPNIPAFPGAPPSVRPVPQFSPLPNYQARPFGISPAMQYQVPVPGQPPNPALRPSFSPLPNGYAPPPPGIARFPSPYPPMVGPLYPMRPPGVLPVLSRPPMPGIIGVRPIMPPIVRPTVPSVTPAEKPQTTVYVGKIASSVEDNFILSLLRLCGPVKGWKRGHNPSGIPVGFGFCEFESAEGVLRALRLLSKLNIDGQQLLLNVNEATKKYLERYVEKKTENSRNLKESQAARAEKDEESVPTDDKNQSVNSSAEDLKNESGKKENHDLASFGMVTDEDREGDRDVVNKITDSIEESLKTRPLPPPPPPPVVADGSRNQSWELQAKPKDRDAAEDADDTEDKNDDDSTSENRATSEQDRPDTSSPDRSRRSNKSRDRDRDLKREQEREVDRYEWESERERVRKEREQRRKIEDAERAYEERLKDWEYREREKEKQRQYEKEREKEKERKRRKEIQYDEDDEEDDRKRWRSSVLEERRRKRLQEKKEDLDDRQKEEEETVEAQRRAEEAKKWLLRHASMLSIANIVNGGEDTVVPEEGSVQSKDKVVEEAYQLDSGNESHKGDAIIENGLGDELSVQSVSESPNRQLGVAPAKKLGFGLAGSGKRAAVPSVFNEEDHDAHKDKKMKPLVPIDYSAEELQAIEPTPSGVTPSNLAAAAEYAKRISNITPKEEKSDAERERSRRNHDRSSQRERGREDVGRLRDENREKVLDRDRDRENGVDRMKTPDKQKLLDAKQLIDMIPKTKEELFSYKINWPVYDKHQLHERMRPWISKKITEFLGEEETTLVDYIVSSTQDHVQASQMLEMLQAILDDEAEMFVLKMWRMLIFEIKKVEMCLAVRSKT